MIGLTVIHAGVTMATVTRLLSLIAATNHNLLPVWMLELPLSDGEGLRLHPGDDLRGVQGGGQHLLDLSREQTGLGVCGEVKVEVDILQESIRSSETWCLESSLQCFIFSMLTSLKGRPRFPCTCV